MDYDLIVIGAGPGGYNAAIYAARAGLKVLLVEKEKIGGVCLNEGCIPTKTLLYSAKLLDGAKSGEKYGIFAENISVDQGKVIDRKNKIVRTLVSGIKNQLKNAGVMTVIGQAAIKKISDGFEITTGDGSWSTKNVIASTGSRAAIPPVKGLEEAINLGFAVTNRGILDLREIPRRLIVIGAGVIGLEMASYFCSAGSQVTVIEMLSKIAGPLDTGLSAVLQKNYEKKGVNFLLDAKLTEIIGDKIKYVRCGEEFELSAEKILISTGRIPDFSGLGLEKLGIETEGRAVKSDTKMRTNISGFYAIGDMNGKSMLAHTAYREGEVAVNHILGIEDRIDYDTIPSVVYTNPEAASVGLSLETARERGLNAFSHEISMRFSGRYLAENEGGDGICKLIVEKGTKRLLGVHMLSNYSSEIIASAAILVNNNATAEEVIKIVFPHPSVSEIIREGILGLQEEA